MRSWMWILFTLPDTLISSLAFKFSVAHFLSEATQLIVALRGHRLQAVMDADKSSSTPPCRSYLSNDCLGCVDGP